MLQKCFLNFEALLSSKLYLLQELYSDEVEFCTKTDKFTVNVRGVLPKYSIDLPHSLSFGTCGVQTVASKTFTLLNKSIETYFKWDIAAPFSIEPALGLLPEKGKCDVMVTFNPNEAHVYDSKAVISFGNGQHRELHISGVGEYLFLYLDKRVIFYFSLGLTSDVCRKTSLHYGWRWN